MLMSTRKGKHTLKIAAQKIGVSDARLRQLIAKGECEAEKWEDPIFPAGYVWLVSNKEIERLKAERTEK